MCQDESDIIGYYQAKLVPLERNLVASVFPLMKIVPAEFCLRQAREAGWIKPQSTVITMFDDVHWVNASEAFLATRLLHRKSTLFCGPTSGAAWMVASQWARRHPPAKVVCIFPDDGHRYVDTVYNDSYLAANHLYLEALPSLPNKVKDPLSAGPSWSSMQWHRRSLAEVTNRLRTLYNPNVSAPLQVPPTAGIGTAGRAE